MIGYRGCYRYTREQDLFNLELDVLGRVADSTPNIRLMIPFVRTAWELERCLNIVQAHPRAGGLPVWVMAEVPSVAYWIPTYAEMGIEGVSIGSNDLTQLVLGVIGIRRCARNCSMKRTRPSSTPSLASLAPAKRPASAPRSAARRRLIDLSTPRSWCSSALTSISVNPDVAHQVRDIIAGAERRILLAATAPWRSPAPTISPRHRLHGPHGRS